MLLLHLNIFSLVFVLKKFCRQYDFKYFLITYDVPYLYFWTIVQKNHLRRIFSSAYMFCLPLIAVFNICLTNFRLRAIFINFFLFLIILLYICFKQIACGVLIILFIKKLGNIYSIGTTGGEIYLLKLKIFTQLECSLVC